MKRLVTACILLLALSIGCGVSLGAVTRTTGRLAASVEQARAAAQDGRPDACQRALLDSRMQWQRAQPFLGSVVRHNELYQADLLYARAIQAAESHDPDELMLQTSELVRLLHQIAAMERPSLHNIL